MRIPQGTVSTLPISPTTKIKVPDPVLRRPGLGRLGRLDRRPPPQHPLGAVGHADVRHSGRGRLLHRGTACREAYPDHDIKVNGYSARYTKETIGLSFIVNRPNTQPGFRLDRTEANDRHINDTMHSYAAEQPRDARYQGNGSGPEPD
jgi:hypothetical protein